MRPLCPGSRFSASHRCQRIRSFHRRAQEILRDRVDRPVGPGPFEDALHGDRVHRRLGDTGGRRRPPGRRQLHSPNVGSRESTRRPRRRRRCAGSSRWPTAPRAGVQYASPTTARDGHRREADRDEARGVPTPHVWVEPGCRRCHRAEVVSAQQIRRTGGELSAFADGTGSLCRSSVGLSDANSTDHRGGGGGIGAAIADALAPTHTLLLAGRPSARLDAVAESDQGHHLAS